MQSCDLRDCISVVAYNGITTSIENQLFCPEKYSFDQWKKVWHILDEYNVLLFDLGGKKNESIMDWVATDTIPDAHKKAWSQENHCSCAGTDRRRSWQEKYVILAVSSSPRDMRLLLLYVPMSSQ